MLAFPARIVPATHARSTLLMASIESVRKRGLFDEYERALDPQHKPALLGAIAGTWLDLEVAHAHYAACDTLGMSADQQVQVGRSTFEGARSTLLGTAVRMARGAGVTPWQHMPLFQRFWDRGFDGGGLSVTRVGPKDAHVTIVACSLLASPYFRNGLRGLAASLVELLASHAYVTEHRHATSDAVTMRVQWA